MKEKEFERLLESLSQAREIHRGKKKPARVFRYAPIKVKEIRKKLRMTQAQFAEMLQLSLATVRNWEQGRTYPEGSAITLLRVADARPDAILDALRAA